MAIKMLPSIANQKTKRGGAADGKDRDGGWSTNVFAYGERWGCFTDGLLVFKRALISQLINFAYIWVCKFQN